MTALFDPDRHVPVVCTVCGATRQPGETTAPACTVDRDRDTGAWARRPHGCLNTYDPATAPLPEGF